MDSFREFLFHISAILFSFSSALAGCWVLLQILFLLLNRGARKAGDADCPCGEQCLRSLMTDSKSNY